jgi:hypothetical protein
VVIVAKGYICPICKEMNEEHRTYCKECGTWLLNANFPAKEVMNATFRKRPSQSLSRKPRAEKRLNIIGWIIFSILFLPIFTTDGKLSYFFTAVGLSGFIYSILVLLCMIFIKRLRRKKMTYAGALAASIVSITIAILANHSAAGASASISQRFPMEKYQQLALTIPYEELARHADKDQGTLIQAKATVTQLIDGKQEQVMVNIAGKGIAIIVRNDAAGNLLENDQIDIYGKVNGFETYTAWTGVKYTIPVIVSDYILLKNK